MVTAPTNRAEHEKARAILIGDNESAEYHPLRAIEGALHDTLAPRFAVETTADHDCFLADRLAAYDLCISYVDRWKEPKRPERVAGLVGYVAAGGGLLVIHNGISYQDAPSFAELVDGKFASHAPFQPLRFEPNAAHPLLRGVANFTLVDEPYRFDPAPGPGSAVILEYLMDGARHPAGWVRRHGEGQVAYLMPGHAGRAFDEPAYREIILRCALWTARAAIASIHYVN